VDTGLIFTTFTDRKRQKCGRGLQPRGVLRVLHQVLAAAGIRRVGMHLLRHQAASILLANGTELAEITLLLGHVEQRTTLDLYAHLLRPTAAKAARTMDAVLK
jgi:site-specific recombinase XerD